MEQISARKKKQIRESAGYSKFETPKKIIFVFSGGAHFPAAILFSAADLSNRALFPRSVC